MNCKNFVGQMFRLLPEAKAGDWSINHFDMSEDFVKREQTLAAFHPGRSREVYDLKPGRYTRLVYKDRIWMSDTPMEIRTQSREVALAHGDCLVAGLGMGIFVLQIQDKPEVRSITVIEKEQAVISLVLPHLPFNTKVKVICGDIYDPKVIDRKLRFDFIFFDIWDNICGDNAYDMGRLKRRFRPLLRKDSPQAWMGSWREQDCLYMRQEARQRFIWL